MVNAEAPRLMRVLVNYSPAPRVVDLLNQEGLIETHPVPEGDPDPAVRGAAFPGAIPDEVGLHSTGRHLEAESLQLAIPKAVRDRLRLGRVHRPLADPAHPPRRFHDPLPRGGSAPC